MNTTRPWRGVRALLALAVGAITLPVTISQPATAAAGTATGVLYRDSNANGVHDLAGSLAETGIAGITDPSGVVLGLMPESGIRRLLGDALPDPANARARATRGSRLATRLTTKWAPNAQTKCYTAL